MNNKTIIGILIMGAVIGVVTIGAFQLANRMNDVVTPFSNTNTGSSYQPTTEEIRTQCINSLRDMLTNEPSIYAIDGCVKIRSAELNK